MKNNNSVDQMFKAFADPNRLRILHLLLKGELCVCDLMGVLRMSQSKVSRHLAYLRRMQLVQDRKEGLWVYYQLRKPQNQFHRHLMLCLTSCFDEVPLLEKDLRNLRQSKGARCAKT